MCKLSTKENTSRAASSSVSSPYQKSQPTVYFRWGRLRVGFHGICASLAFFVTIASLVIQQSNDSMWFIGSSVILNSVTAWDARSLLDQVPLKTEIVPGIVAPHREAFKRTMSMMHYGNLRIIGKLLTSNNNIMGGNNIGEETNVYKILLWMFAWYSFFPLGSDFQNGNTWIFVVPMFLGVTTDMIQLYTTNSVLLEHYLIIELSALTIAFWFTLAFRGYISVPQIYLGSALFVATLFFGGVYVIFG